MQTIDWSSLPDQPWTLVMQQLSLKDRFTASGTCNKLRAAGAAATAEVCAYRKDRGVDRPGEWADRGAQLSRTEQVQSFLQYVESHSHHIRCLRVQDGFTQVLGQLWRLPCPNLQGLELRHLSLQLGGTPPGLLDSCSAVTKLVLRDCQCLNPPRLATMIAGLTALQHLGLLRVSSGSSGGSLALPGDALQQLTRLTHLTLRGADNMTACLQHLSCLMGLQQATMAFHDSFSGLSSRLTALTSLSLNYCTLDPAMLLPHTQLQHLHMWQLTAPADMLLPCVAGMPHLQRLYFDISSSSGWPASLAAFTALTASSQLEELQLWRVGLPVGAWQSMFPAGRTWPTSSSWLLCRALCWRAA